MSRYKLTSEDRVLFLKITLHIKNNSSDYQEAGKWLNEYCSKESFRQRTKELIKYYEKEKAEGPNSPTEEIELLNCMLEADTFLSPSAFGTAHIAEDLEAMKKRVLLYKGTADSYEYYWMAAVDDLLLNCNNVPYLRAEESRRILLMTWIMTDFEIDTNSLDLNISEFGKMQREKRQLLYQKTLVHNDRIAQQWMEAVKTAWGTIKAEEALDPEKPAAMKLKSKIRKKRLGRPKVSKDEAVKRRKLKFDWERYRDTIKGADKKPSFCVDKKITVEYLNNLVLRWCRDHPK